jgi:hypothetical protein
MDVTVSAAFTQDGGAPATGLTLAEIGLHLQTIDPATGTATVLWDGTEHPTSEVAGLGIYLRHYGAIDDGLIVVAGAHYTGAEELDGDWITATREAALDEVIEGTLSLAAVLRILLAGVAGKTSGGGTTTPAFRDVADTKNRITATMDSNRNRTAVTLDGS